jgi:hypothetical protein
LSTLRPAAFACQHAPSGRFQHFSTLSPSGFARQLFAFPATHEVPRCGRQPGPTLLEALRDDFLKVEPEGRNALKAQAKPERADKAP